MPSSHSSKTRFMVPVTNERIPIFDSNHIRDTLESLYNFTTIQGEVMAYLTHCFERNGVDTVEAS